MKIYFANRRQPIFSWGIGVDENRAHRTNVSLAVKSPNVNKTSGDVPKLVTVWEQSIQKSRNCTNVLRSRFGRRKQTGLPQQGYLFSLIITSSGASVFLTDAHWVASVLIRANKIVVAKWWQRWQLSCNFVRLHLQRRSAFESAIHWFFNA